MKVLATMDRSISAMAILVAIFAATPASAEQPFGEPTVPNEAEGRVDFDFDIEDFKIEGPLHLFPRWFFGLSEAECPLPAPQSPVSEELIPGEPAEVILELRQRLGGSPLQGTQFDEAAESPHSRSGEKVLVDSIRALEKEDQMQGEQAPEVQSWCSACASISAVESPDAEKAVTALRKAGRACEEAADELEAVNLFDRADHLREVAATLRQQSREYLGHQAQSQVGHVPSAGASRNGVWSHSYPARIQAGHSPVGQPGQFMVRGIELGSQGFLVVSPDEPDPRSGNSKLISDIRQLRAELRQVRMELERHSRKAVRNAGSGKTGLPVR